MEELRKQIGDDNLDGALRRRAKLTLDQAEEALLCQDTRERHATRERYEEILRTLREFHLRDPANIPSFYTCVSFDGDSFCGKLLEVCVSHNEDAETLVRRDAENPERPRFPGDFPVGCSTVDLHMIATGLRLADILDFDRERTPPVLFHYLVPGTLSPAGNQSVLEWGKHMAISNWHLESDAVVFRGRCRDHIIHHAIVQFCTAIQDEIAASRATFGAMKEETSWPFCLPATVKANIHEEAYHYVPYRFELDDQRIYELLMGGAIYDNPLVALRELLQNAVDACRLRDALTQLYEPYTPKTTDRIVVRYEEPNGATFSQPALSVTDTGTGMDAFILERYFLKVGQSYYRSVEFNRERVALRRKDLDFSPVSDFGIVADRVKVETAMWEPLRGDSRKRTLLIDGPTRLIRLDETSNEGSKRFKGTRVTLFLSRGSGSSGVGPPTWDEITKYLKDICQDLPYRLNLEHAGPSASTVDWIDPKPLTAQVPRHLESSTLRIPVRDVEFGLEGEIALTNPYKAGLAERELATSKPISRVDDDQADHRRLPHAEDIYTELLRGGFKIGSVPGLPDAFPRVAARARLRLTWQERSSRRYLSTNLARNASSDDPAVADNVARVWLSYLLEHVDHLEEGQLYDIRVRRSRATRWNWLERYDALTVYRLAANSWRVELGTRNGGDDLSAWEEGKIPQLRRIHSSYLYGGLLSLVLPRITSNLVGRQGLYVSRPTENWRAILREWRDYVSHPVHWERFAEYLDPIADLLWYRNYPSYFNARFRDRLASIDDEQVEVLRDGLYELFEARDFKRPAVLKKIEVEVLRRATDQLGDLSVGSNFGSCQLKSFAVPDPASP